MLFSPLKQGWNEKIRTLLLTKLFEVLEWKWPYFWDLVIFWCCKSSIKNPNFGASAINREWLNYHGTKSDGSFCSYLTPVELLLKSKKIEAPYCVHKRYENFSSKRVQKVPNEGKLISRIIRISNLQALTCVQWRKPIITHLWITVRNMH